MDHSSCKYLVGVDVDMTGADEPDVTCAIHTPDFEGYVEIEDGEIVEESFSMQGQWWTENPVIVILVTVLVLLVISLLGMRLFRKIQELEEEEEEQKRD